MRRRGGRPLARWRLEVSHNNNNKKKNGGNGNISYLLISRVYVSCETSYVCVVLLFDMFRIMLLLFVYVFRYLPRWRLLFGLAAAALAEARSKVANDRKQTSRTRKHANTNDEHGIQRRNNNT